MNADPIILQMKYTGVIELFAKTAKIPLEQALKLFYHSVTYKLMSKGVSDMHCMSDPYLVEDLMTEYNIKGAHI